MSNGQDPYVRKLDDTTAIGEWMACTEGWLMVIAIAFIILDIIALFAVIGYYFK